MKQDKFLFVRDFLVKHIEVVAPDLTVKQWNDLMITIQDAMFYEAPKEKIENIVKIPKIRLLNPDIKDFVEQTNRRLNNVR